MRPMAVRLTLSFLLVIGITSVIFSVVGVQLIGVLEQPYLEIQRRSTLTFLAVSLTGALLTVALAHFLSKRITVPLKELVAASREVAAGNLGTKVPIRSNDELAELARAFNTMGERLQRRDRELKEFAKNKIMESERLAIIGQLAAGVAHELNNPLQGIVAFSEILIERAGEDDPRRASLEKIATQAKRCTTIIRGLLDFSRRRPPHKRPSDVCALLDECLGLIENQAQFHDITVIKKGCPNLPPVILDPSQMQQVFMNLIINAAEAMPEGGELRIGARFDAAANGIEITFSDTGSGIREENLDLIFDPFFTTKEVGHGTGLGLAISFGIVKQHGGTIAVDSQRGAGTTFTIHLPEAAANGVQAA